MFKTHKTTASALLGSYGTDVFCSRSVYKCYVLDRLRSDTAISWYYNICLRRISSTYISRVFGMFLKLFFPRFAKIRLVSSVRDRTLPRGHIFIVTVRKTAESRVVSIVSIVRSEITEFARFRNETEPEDRRERVLIRDPRRSKTIVSEIRELWSAKKK